MKPLIIGIISIVSIILIIIILLIILHHKTSQSIPNIMNSLNNTFNNTTSDLSNIGGLLANNFGVEWFDSMLEHGDVTLQDTPVCAHVNRKTCTAYSYVRKDMIPMLFMFPGIASNVPCGILLDTKKVWPLITLMATVDGDTNNRSCCTNESGSPILTRSPFNDSSGDWCIWNTLQAKYGKDNKYLNYAVYIPSIDKGANYPTSCNGDKTCMYNNSGGNVNQWFMNSGQLINQNLPQPSDACVAGDYKTCFNFTEVDPANVPFEIRNMFYDSNYQPKGYLMQSISNNCPTCIKPYLCVFKDSGDVDKYKIKEEDNRIAVYIGEDGSGYKDVVSNTLSSNSFLGDIAIKQCRFEKQDWNSWINVVKQWYKQLLSIINKDNSMSPEYNYLLANPEIPNYFENEVNLYIDPDTNSDEYKKQNSIWQDAIVGFYYTGTTCESQLSILNNIPTKYENGKTYTTNIDRCDGFYNMATDDRRRLETINIENQRQLVYKVADMFNKKHNKNIPVLLCTADSNAFPNYNSLNKALNGLVTFNDIFKVDPGYSFV